MKKEKTLLRKLYQLGANGQPIIGSGIGVSQSPFLSRIFDPSQNLAQFFNTMFKAAIVVGAMLAVLRLGYAGFVYMTTDVMSQKQSARSIISNAVLGLLLLLAVWLILNQINPNILNLNVLQGVSPVNGAVLPSQSTPGATQPSQPPAQSSFSNQIDNPTGVTCDQFGYCQ